MAEHYGLLETEAETVNSVICRRVACDTGPDKACGPGGQERGCPLLLLPPPPPRPHRRPPLPRPPPQLKQTSSLARARRVETGPVLAAILPQVNRVQ
eukprot:274381-Rhodomonas_salina.1